MKSALETGRTRLVAAGFAFALAFFLLAWRLVDLGLGGPAAEPSFAGATGQPLATGRADIVDRNGIVLATTLPVASLYADAREVPDPEAAAQALAAVLPGVDAGELAEKLASERSFLWVQRQLTPRQQYEVNRLGIPGLYFQREMARVYPQGQLVSHLVGFTNVDNRGLAGAEQQFDERLRSSTQPLQLSIDLRLQDIITQELQASIDSFSAVGGASVVLDLHTGELLAAVSLPSYDPRDPAKASEDQRFNRVTLGVYEMGSTFKVFTVAMALEEHVVDLSSGYDASHPIRVAGYTISDYKGKNRWLSVPEIFIYSSNIGAAQMGRDVGTERQKAYMAALGLTSPAAIELPEIGHPMVPKPWRDINTLTVSYGHGIAVSPLQLSTAVAATVNGGILRPPTLLKNDNGTVGTRVLSEETSAALRWLLRLNVLQGSGKRAEVAGYLVGGKTGTADKLVNGHYATDKRIASFVGAFPMDDPRYLVLAIVDEPKGTEATQGYATGSWVGAPLVGRIVQRIGPLLGVAPREPAIVEETDTALIPVSLGGRPLASR
ncbi:MAG TPA: penicillin-binding protein 2 [Kiloniellales bacterium]|nr:penicillin-binding protein 2 [Kiloniellales bacterium]